MAQSPSAAEWIVQRARILLLAAQGHANVAIARELQVSRPTVLLWRKRFRRFGIPAVLEHPTPGRAARLSPAKVEAIVQATLHTTPPGARRWSLRTMARAQHLPRSTVHRIWQQHGLSGPNRPWKTVAA